MFFGGKKVRFYFRLCPSKVSSIGSDNSSMPDEQDPRRLQKKGQLGKCTSFYSVVVLCIFVEIMLFKQNFEGVHHPKTPKLD